MTGAFRTYRGKVTVAALAVTSVLALGIVRAQAQSRSDTETDFERAEPVLRSAFEAQLAALDLAAAGQSERQQLAALAQARGGLSAYLHLAIRAPQYREPAYRYALTWKGAVFARQRAMRAARDLPEFSKIYSELEGVAAQLARVGLHRARPGEEASWQRQMSSLTQKKEILERQLSAKSRELGPQPAVTLENLRAVLPSDTVLVDFIHADSAALPTTSFGDHSTAQGPADHAQLKTEPRLLAFLIRRDGPLELIVLPEAAEVRSTVTVWRITSDPKGRPGMGLTIGSRTAAAWLRENLWQPIENRLSSETKTILISADGPLAKLPFAALPGKEPGTYLIEDWAIAMVPAAQAIPALLATAGRTPPGRFFLLGALDVDSRTRDAVPPSASLDAKTVQEILRREFLTLRSIYEKRFTSSGMFAISSGSATEYAFRQNAPKYRQLHIAAHGMFGADWARTALERSTYGQWPIDESRLQNSKSVEEYHPSLLSAIALAPSSLAAYEAINDGILSAEEIQTLDLRGTDLVVLSSCQTALGEQADGDVLLGIQRAFHLAGTKTVISALWSPSAEVGEVLMERFYDNLWNKGRNKLAAFREAQLWLLREGRLEKLLYNGAQWPAEFKNRDRLPPYFWAGFVLSGEWLGRAAPVER